VIAASRPVIKEVSTGAGIRAKQGTEQGVHKLLASGELSNRWLQEVQAAYERLVCNQIPIYLT